MKFLLLLLLVCHAFSVCTQTGTLLQCAVSKANFSSEFALISRSNAARIEIQLEADKYSEFGAALKLMRTNLLELKLVGALDASTGAPLTTVTSQVRDSFIQVFHAINVTIANIKFEKMLSVFRGSAIRMDNVSSAVISNCEFVQNVATDSGGAIYVSNIGQITIRSSTFDQNSIMTQNSGLRKFAVATQRSSKYKMKNDTFVNNVPNPRYIFRSNSVSGSYSEVYTNILEGTDNANGGAIAFDKVFSASIFESKFSSNSAGLGGSVSCSQCTKLQIHSSIFQDNKASVQGSALYLAYTQSFDTDSNTYVGNQCSKLQCRLIYVLQWAEVAQQNSFSALLIVAVVFASLAFLNAFVLYCSSLPVLKSIGSKIKTRHTLTELICIFGTTLKAELQRAVKKVCCSCVTSKMEKDIAVVNQASFSFSPVDIFSEICYNYFGISTLAKFELDWDTVKKMCAKSYAMVISYCFSLLQIVLIILAHLFLFLHFFVPTMGEQQEFLIDSADWFRAVFRNNRFSLLILQGVFVLIAMVTNVKTTNVLLVWRFDNVREKHKVLALLLSIMAPIGIFVIMIFGFSGNDRVIAEGSFTIMLLFTCLFAFEFFLLVLFQWYCFYSLSKRMRTWFEINVAYPVRVKKFDAKTVFERFTSMISELPYDTFQGQLLTVGTIATSLTGAVLFQFKSNILSDTFLVLMLPLGVNAFISFCYFLPLIRMNARANYFVTSYLNSAIRFSKLAHAVRKNAEGKDDFSWMKLDSRLNFVLGKHEEFQKQQVEELKKELDQNSLYYNWNSELAMERSREIVLSRMRGIAKNIFELSGEKVDFAKYVHQDEQPMQDSDYADLPVKSQEDVARDLAEFQSFAVEHNFNVKIFGFEITFFKLLVLLVSPSVVFSVFFNLFSQIETYMYLS